MTNKRSGFSWASAAGKEAIKRLDAYGELRRYELAGEVAALTSASGGGGRSKPGDMPGSFHRAWDVELSLREWGVAPGCRLLRLLDFMWASGREERVVAYRYVFADNAESGAHRMTVEEVRMKGEPGRYLQRHEETAMVSVYDLDDFEDPYMDAGAKSFAPPRGEPEEYWEARRVLLELLHDRFALWMVARRGLGEHGATTTETAASRIPPHPDSLPSYGAATAHEHEEIARVTAKRPTTGHESDEKSEDTPIGA